MWTHYRIMCKNWEMKKSPQLEKTPCSSEDPAQPKINEAITIFFNSEKIKEKDYRASSMCQVLF